MNIFKKNIELSFFEKVEQRIIQELCQILPQKINEKIKNLFPNFINWTICFTIMSFIPLHTSSYLNSDSVLFLFLQHFGYSAIFTGIGGLIGYPLIYLILKLYRKHLIKNRKHIAIHYEILAKLFLIEKSLDLNKDEINELLSMKLSEEQIHFLQETILNTNNFNLENLNTLILKHSQEDIEIQQHYEQHRFNLFLNKHQINSHPYLTIEKINKNNETKNFKEKTLSSRL